MLTNQKTFDRFRVIALLTCSAVGFIALLLSATFATISAHEQKNDLVERAQIIADSIDPEEIQTLKGTEADSGTYQYQELKERLANIKVSNREARSVYLAGQRNGQIFFYGDSETPTSRDFSTAGKAYPEASKEFKSIFATGNALAEGPLNDSYGTFISGLAPVYDMNDKYVVAVVGIDIASSTYVRNIALATIAPLAVGAFVITVVMYYDHIRKKNLRMLAVQSQLVSVASHELRSPITGIRWASEMLMQSVQDAESLEMIKAIESSAIKLQSSTDDILELTKALKQQKISFSDVNILGLIENVVDTHKLAAKAKNVKLHVYAKTFPDPAIIQCDNDKMKRVFENIISNAIKYTKQGTEVKVRYSSDPESHNISVTDSGIGIPDNEQSKIFTGFYRASNAKQSKINGTGFGLYLVKAIIDQHGGHITVVSKQNVGTTFIISLPRDTAN